MNRSYVFYSINFLNVFKLNQIKIKLNKQFVWEKIFSHYIVWDFQMDLVEQEIMVK